MDYQKLQDCLEQWSSIYKRTDPESGYYKKDKATEEEIDRVNKQIEESIRGDSSLENYLIKDEIN